MIGERIKLARESAGITQKELARRVGACNVTIWQYEKNRTLPNSSMLIALSKALKVKIEYFFRPDIMRI